MMLSTRKITGRLLFFLQFLRFSSEIYEQVIPIAECFLSPLLCQFQKGYNTQLALLKFLETSKAMINSRGFARAFLMDLSKAFDSLNLELLLAK